MDKELSKFYYDIKNYENLTNLNSQSISVFTHHSKHNEDFEAKLALEKQRLLRKEMLIDQLKRYNQSNSNTFNA